MVTFRPRDSNKAAKDAAAMPLPKDDTTPPVTNTYFVILSPELPHIESEIIPVKSLAFFKNWHCTWLKPSIFIRSNVAFKMD